jgi:hypothetical protein
MGVNDNSKYKNIEVYRRVAEELKVSVDFVHDVFMSACKEVHETIMEVDPYEEKLPNAYFYKLGTFFCPTGIQDKVNQSRLNKKKKNGKSGRRKV